MYFPKTHGQRFSWPGLFFWLADAGAMIFPVVGIPIGEQGICAAGLLMVIVSLSRHVAIGDVEIQINGLLKFWGYFVIFFLIIQALASDPLVFVTKQRQSEAYERLEWLTEKVEKILLKDAMEGADFLQPESLGKNTSLGNLFLSERDRANKSW